MPFLGTLDRRVDRDPARTAAMADRAGGRLIDLGNYLQARKEQEAQSMILEALSGSEDPRAGLMSMLQQPDALSGAPATQGMLTKYLLQQTLQPTKQFGVAPWHQNPNFADTPTAQAAAEAPERKRKSTELARLRKALGANRKEHRDLSRWKADEDVEVGTPLHTRLSEQLTGLDQEERDIQARIEALATGSRRRASPSGRGESRRARARKPQPTTRPAAQPGSKQPIPRAVAADVWQRSGGDKALAAQMAEDLGYDPTRFAD